MVKITVIDENPCIVAMLSEEWLDKGFIVEGIHESQTIIGAIDRSCPDLVILDLYFKGEKRWDILMSIRLHYPDLPIVIFTALEEFERDSRITLADDFVIKNFSSLDILNDKIAKLSNMRSCYEIRNGPYAHNTTLHMASKIYQMYLQISQSAQ